MPGHRNGAKQVTWLRAARLALEYVIVLGLALLSSYWIVEGRWISR